MNHRTYPVLLLCLLSFTVTATANEKNWPQWRGPEGSGKTGSIASVTEWDTETNLKWRSLLPEAGNSTPVVWGDRIFLTQPLA